MPESSSSSFHFTTLSNGWTVGRFGVLDGPAGFVHAVTTREGFDVRQAQTDPAGAAVAIAEALDLTGAAFCKQVHGGEVLLARAAGLVGRADGLVTNTPGLGVMGFSADCPIVLAADTRTGAVGMAHASWRGSVRRITERMIARLVECFGSRPADLVACLAPSAGPCCYEVGQALGAPNGDVRQAALAGIGPHADAFFQRRGGKLYFDLWSANADQLRRAGVPGSHIHTAGVCTICGDRRLCSFRREGDAAGRFVAVIAAR